MSNGKRQTRKSKTADGGTELRFTGVEFKPAPDAQDRLRRLFTILARVMEGAPSVPGTDPSPEDGGWEED